MGLGDALDDRQAEADAGVVGADAFGAALERLDERGDQLRGELLAGVLDREHHTLGRRTLVVTHTVPCSGRLWTIALCTRFVRQLQQERVRADGRGRRRRRSRW